MQIQVINPNASAPMTEAIGQAARRVAGSGTHIVLAGTTSGPASIESAFDEALALPGLLGYLAVLHVALLVLAGVLGRAFGLNRGDWIAALFAAPQKTLGLGAPLITAYFADRPDLTAVAMLPLLFYHPLQLLVAGLVAGRLRVVLPDDGRYNG